MEFITRNYSCSRSYKKLEKTPSSVSASKRIARLNSSRNKKKKRSFWINIKVYKRLKVKMPSPRKLLLRLRDAYVNVMFMFDRSNKKKQGKLKSRELEMRMVFEIYSALLAAPKQFTA